MANAIQPPGCKTNPPTANRLLIGAQLPGDVGVGKSAGRQQDDAGPPGQSAIVAAPLLQPGSLRKGQCDGDGAAHPFILPVQKSSSKSCIML